jgi:hypothetical protein
LGCGRAGVPVSSEAMQLITRTGLVVVALVSSAIGLQSGCSSSDSVSGFHHSDASVDGPSGNEAGGGPANSGGGGGSNLGGAGGNSPAAGGAATSTGGSGVLGDSGTPVKCKLDADCTAPSPRCDKTAGHCVQCLFDNECAEADRCTAGACAPLAACTNSRDCRSNADGRTICSATTKLCVECAADLDCGDHQVCAVDTCVDSGTCTPGAADAGSGCKAEQVCAPSGKCVECAADKDCATGTKCIASACRTPCASDNACQAGNQLCDTKLGACVACTADKDCDPLEYCATGVCKKDVCAQGVKSCVSNTVVECTANGDGIVKPVACPSGEKCVAASGTASCAVPKLPDGGTPPPASCSDGTKNGNETAVDCGGACKKCGEGEGCAVATDCTSNVCQPSCSGLLCFPGTRDKTCRSAACDDKVKNGNETDIDCGGAACKRCPVASKCTGNADCETDICQGGACIAAKCTADQCPACFVTDKACCKPNGLCGCATVLLLGSVCQ